MSDSLPIEPLLPDLRRALAQDRAVVLQAPPGAGKTTRVPLALLDEPWLAGKTILMLEPRRLAAGNAAAYMARQRGEAVGDTVGYTVRYRREVSRCTRIEVVTEGILTRRLQADPELTGVGLVIFDEFHERNLNSDLALALCRDAQFALRDDLKLLVMSATLDGAPLAQLLDAPLLTSAGRSHPVEIRYTPPADERRIAANCAAAIRRALAETSGDILVFLPGAGEIERCRQQLTDLADIDIRPLYGELDFERQQQAILPGSRRRVVLATNIAETSLTIEGVTVVIDSGYARQPRFEPAGGMTRLETARISAASAEQRAGRAGRLGPGICYRLWSEGIQGALLPFTPPEIRSTDLTPLALELAAWGIDDPSLLSWLDPPPDGQLQAGRDLLRQLGALDRSCRLTPLGRELAALPIHPRLGRLLLAGRERDALPLACDLAALLAERDPWRGNEPQHPSGCDLFDRMEELWRRRRNRRLEQFAGVERAARYWRNVFKLPSPARAPEGTSRQEVALLLAQAFADRIGRQRTPGSADYLLSSGKGARLSSFSALAAPPFLVAVELHQRAGSPEITLASTLTREQIDQLYPCPPWQRRVEWDRTAGRVIAVEEQRIGALVLAERGVRAPAGEISAALCNGIRQEGLAVLGWSDEAETLRNRIALLREHDRAGNWPDLADQMLLENLELWLFPFLGTVRTRANLRGIDLRPALLALLDWPQQQRLARLAPERLEVPSGSRIRVVYPAGGLPVLAVKLQELFGLAETPRIVGGKLAVQLHLLSPAGRPLQVTQDLRHFWNQVYPEVKKEMKGRYPKHPWPDDPWSAPATRKTKRRMQN